MTKPVLGLALGGALGVFDGLSALVSAPGDPNGTFVKTWLQKLGVG